ncbi:MAG: uracil-DNA glycosylase [Desulforhopalus sp.]|nr:uracil-DNA glycosylase [Desulforhopalus sp.]
MTEVAGKGAEYSGLELMDALRGILRYHRELGIDPWPESAALEAFFAVQPPLPPEVERVAGMGPMAGLERRGGAQAVHAAHSPSRPVQQRGEADSAALAGSVAASLAKINAAVAACTSCELHEGCTLRPVGKRLAEGRGPVKLMVIGTWPQSEEGPLFGVSEDEMLVRMMQALHLPLESVYVSNAIKCAPAKEKNPAPKHAKSCLVHIASEIATVRPEFICLMGAVPVRSVLNSDYQVPQVRGRFYPYQLREGNPIPLLVTWHPTTLLADLSLKRAAWDDLKLLARKMGLVTRS